MEKKINQYKQQIFRITAKNTKLDDQYIELKKHNIFAEKENAILEKNNVNLNKKVNSKSYKLGHLLLHETRSIMAFLKLPKRVYLIWRSEKKTNTVQEKKQSKPKKDEIKKNHLSFEHIQLPNIMQVPIEISNIKNLRVACIMDTFTYNIFEPEANFEQLTPKNWQSDIENIKPDVLFVESAWRGKKDLWKGKIAKLSQALIDIIVYCQSNNIKTIFWNKEDPFHFNDFINTAKYFDYIFTTDSDMIKKYKEIVTHDRVYLLPFACQPKLHNPIEKYERKDTFSFAGAFYPNFPKRSTIFESFIENLIMLDDIDIYDRNYNNPTSPFQYPEEYKPFIRGTLKYNEIDKAYKGYKYAINLSTVTTSPTMFARRVFELMASNTLVLSNESEGIRHLFGDLVVSTNNGKKLVEKIIQFRKTPLFEKKIKLLALRKVMLEHTAKDRLEFIVQSIDPTFHKKPAPYAAVISYIESEEELESSIQSFTLQSYENKKLVLILSKTFKTSKSTVINDNFIYTQITQPLAEIIPQDIEYVAIMSADDYFGENYLLDLMLATKYSNADVIGKKEHYTLTPDNTLIVENSDQAYHYVTTIPARCSIIKKEVIMSKNRLLTPNKILSSIHTEETILSIDEFNYCKNARKYNITTEQKKVIDDLQDINTGIKNLNTNSEYST